MLMMMVMTMMMMNEYGKYDRGHIGRISDYG